MRSSSVIPCSSNAAGFVTCGCVGQARSLGESDAGTGRSSIGHTGCPVSRLKTYAQPCFVASITMGTRRPSTVTSTTVGAFGLS
jgi:hypothetical protein